MLAEWVAELVVCKTVLQIFRVWTFRNRDKGLLLDVSESDLPTVIQTAGYDAPVVKYRYVRVERSTGPSGRWLYVAICVGPFESGILMDVNAVYNVETFVFAAKMVQVDLRTEAFCDFV